MHELSLAAALIDTVQEAANKHHFSGVKSVVIEVGELSCVDPEALKFAVVSSCDGSELLKKADIIIRRLPGELQCRHCNEVFNSSEIYTLCPSCSGYGAAIVGGDNARLLSLDVYN
jgi:hydrogenase nickel incorporation protein HypA/HybF